MNNLKRNERERHQESDFKSSDSATKEAAVVTERDRLINILNSMGDGIYIINQQYDIEYVNPALEAQFGTINGRKCHQYLENREGVCPWCKNKAVFHDGRTVHWEWYSEKTGRTYDLMDTPFRNADGSVSKLEVFRDITERKQMEQALRDNERDLNHAQAVAHTGSWRMDVQRNQLLWSDESHRIFGIPIGTPMTYEAFLSCVHPQDREYVDRKWALALRGEPYDIEHRIIVGDKVKWVRERAELEFDSNGELKGGFGTVQDITGRKRVEEKLVASELRYRRLFETAQDGILILNADTGVINDVNPFLIDMLGHSREEFLGKKLWEIGPIKDSRASRSAFRTLKESGYVRYEDLPLETKSGKLIEVEFVSNIYKVNHSEVIQCNIRDISERKRIENELRVKDFAVTSAASGIAIAGLDGILTYVNPACLSMWDYEREEEVLGKPAIDFFADKKTFGMALKTVLEEGIWQDEGQARRSDGSTFDVQVLANLVTDADGEPFCMMASFVDITERKRTEEALRQSEENYRALFDSAVIGTIVLDSVTMKVLIANQAAAKILGFSCVEEALAVDPFDFVLPEDKERVTELAEKALFEQNSQLTYDLRVLSKDGRKIWISATGARIMHQGRLAGLISFTDITEKKQQNERFMLADRLASIGELAAGAAHELNNPLTSVIGFSQLLMEKDISDDIRQDLTFIHSEAQRAASITKNLLAFARKHKPVKRLNQINEIIEDVLKLRTYEHKIHDIKVEKQLAPDLPKSMVDYFQMQQVFFNIVINAEYFMTEAHKRGTLTITTEKENGTVIIKFTDDGPGIPLENLSQIFNPFFTTKVTGKGTGLGLSICHGVVSEHGGKIQARSQQGEGTTIFVELPINGSQLY